MILFFEKCESPEVKVHSSWRLEDGPVTVSGHHFERLVVMWVKACFGVVGTSIEVV